MSDEKPTVTVDLRDEDEEWVQYARNQKTLRPDREIDEKSLEVETKRKLQQAIRQHLESLGNNILDVSKCFELSDHELFDELAGLVLRRVQNVEAIRNTIQERLHADEDLSAFELPRRTREVTAEHIVEEAVGKAEVRSLAGLLLDKNQLTLDTDEFETDTPQTGTSWVSDRVFTRSEEDQVAENQTRLNSRE